MLRPVLIGLACALGVTAFAAAPAPTFYKDVLPVLENRCQECHRPGEAAPMSLLTYEQARPWAKAIKAVVLTRKMPPWLADPHYGSFTNERRLPPDELETLVSWADTGAAEGDPKGAPPPRQFVNGWSIGTPDAVFEMQQPVHVPASGTIDYTYMVIPTHFTENKWVQFAEVRPGNRAVVHHVIAFLRPPGSKWMSDAKPGVPFIPDKNHKGSDDAVGELLVGYAPGLPAGRYAADQAKLIPAGSDIVLQLHYTANGHAADDQTRIGLIFAKEPPKQRVMTLGVMNTKFSIPPDDPDYEARSEMTLHHDAELVGMMPHMHLRGKDFEYRAVFPDGRSETLLRVPKYDFSWQLYYYLNPIALPSGSRIECTAHWDNSPNNPANPDPKAEVHWGDQSWEEMMIGWIDVAFPANMDPVALFQAPKKARGAD